MRLPFPREKVNGFHISEHYFSKLDVVGSVESVTSFKRALPSACEEMTLPALDLKEP